MFRCPSERAFGGGTSDRRKSMNMVHDARSARPFRLVALVGNPNSGKTTLFNALTGLRQKVGNYPGVTVERKEGRLRMTEGADATLLDLPGTYSLTPGSPDEQIATDVLLGTARHTPPRHRHLRR